MSDTYSALLAAAVVALACSTLLLLAKRWRAVPPVLVAAFGFSALLLDAASFAYHWSHDHAHGSPEYMPALPFLREHPAFLVVAVGSVAVLALLATSPSRAQRAA